MCKGGEGGKASFSGLWSRVEAAVWSHEVFYFNVKSCPIGGSLLCLHLRPFKDAKCCSSTDTTLEEQAELLEATETQQDPSLGIDFLIFFEYLKLQLPMEHYVERVTTWSLLWLISVPFRVLFISITGCLLGYIKPVQPSLGALQGRGSHLQLLLMICAGATQKEHMSEHHRNRLQRGVCGTQWTPRASCRREALLSLLFKWNTSSGSQYGTQGDP